MIAARVPEPEGYAMLGVGLPGLAGRRRGRRGPGARREATPRS
ncbi:MAG: PEP-CTERM sorting domain-containing protein [Burkholderiaceae bacterium]|nr:PEP-CTERM sorting domain-containing protein [Burkholderiaceae bacterium]